jgi:hypothetical protein
MFQIFSPFKSVNKNSEVIITSWGIASSNKMEEVVNNINRAAKVQLLVGYSKETHNLDILKQTLMYYKRMGWIVKVLPGFHAKIWLIDNDAYVGSCNFFRDTIHNYMHKTRKTPRLNNFVKTMWRKSYNINEGTKLELLPSK